MAAMGAGAATLLMLLLDCCSCLGRFPRSDGKGRVVCRGSEDTAALLLLLLLLLDLLDSSSVLTGWRRFCPDRGAALCCCCGCNVDAADGRAGGGPVAAAVPTARLD